MKDKDEIVEYPYKYEGFDSIRYSDAVFDDIIRSLENSYTPLVFWYTFFKDRRGILPEEFLEALNRFALLSNGAQISFGDFSLLMKGYQVTHKITVKLHFYIISYLVDWVLDGEPTRVGSTCVSETHAKLPIGRLLASIPPYK